MEEQQTQTILEMYAKRRSMKAISRAVGISDYCIQKWLKENGYWTGHKWLQYYYDEFYFDKIDTEEKAYWLGFIYADGYLGSNGTTVGIELKSTDTAHLEKFRQALQAESTVKIYHKNSTYGPQDNTRFVINSKHMNSILLGYYGSINKTFEGTFPLDKIPEELKKDFVRGFFDGDGSISFKKIQEECLIHFSISLIGQKATLEAIEQFSNFSWNWSQRHPEKHTDNYQIGCGRVNDSLTFLDCIYSHATVFLDRKYQRYLQIRENREIYKAKARV